MWVLKLDSNGAVQWQKTYGGIDYERADSVQQTVDGGYVVLGYGASFRSDYHATLVLKLDNNGNIPECDIIGISNATVTDTTVMGTNTSITESDTSVIGNDTTVFPQDTACVIATVCPDETDTDEDGIPDSTDNCPNTPNEDQLDQYPPGGNGIGDACECEGNFNCSEDDDCDGSDAASFKIDFGRSIFSDPCTNELICNGDFDCDGDCDGTDASLFKQDFGRSRFLNPCPVCEVGDWCVYQ